MATDTRDLELLAKAGRHLAEALVITEQTKQEIATLVLDEAMNGARKWEAYRQCMKRAGASRADQNAAAEICIRHRRRAGDILRETARASGFIDGGIIGIPPSIPTYAELGITKLIAQRLRDGARVPEEVFEALIAKIAGDDNRELAAKEVERIGRLLRVAEKNAEWSADDDFDEPPEVIHGDGIEFLLGIEPSSVDLLLTDPPYSTDVEDIEAFARSWLTLGLSRVKPTGRAYIFIGAYPKEVFAYLDAFYRPDDFGTAHQMWLEMILPWVYRNTMGPATLESYKLNWQACLYFAGPEVKPLNTDSLNEKFSVQDINAPDGRHDIRLHAWQKPDEVAERFIRHATMPGDLIIDPFAGTGTFLAAAARLGRIGRGCEASEEMLGFCRQRGVLGNGERTTET